MLLHLSDYPEHSVYYLPIVYRILVKAFPMCDIVQSIQFHTS